MGNRLRKWGMCVRYGPRGRLLHLNASWARDFRTATHRLNTH